jgi:hypothetical protein
VTDPLTTLRDALERLHIGHRNERRPEEQPCPYCDLRADAIAALAQVETLIQAARWERDTHPLSHGADCDCPICAALAPFTDNTPGGWDEEAFVAEMHTRAGTPPPRDSGKPQAHP